MKTILLILLSTLFLNAQSILVINSNPKTKKYAEAIEEFSQEFNAPFDILDISNKNDIQIREALYTIYPDIIYAVGSKAYSYASEYLPEKPIYYSSLAGWNTVHAKQNRFGIFDELPLSVQITLLKAIFTDLKSIGVVYSRYTEKVMNDLIDEGKIFNINIIPLPIDGASSDKINFEPLVSQSDILLVIPDPLFLEDEHVVKKFFETADHDHKPVIAYHELFIKYGAVLSISADNPTIGRQIASMIQNYDPHNPESSIQYPAGTRIILNKPQAVKIDMHFDPILWSFVSETVE